MLTTYENHIMMYAIPIKFNIGYVKQVPFGA